MLPDTRPPLLTDDEKRLLHYISTEEPCKAEYSAERERLAALGLITTTPAGDFECTVEGDELILAHVKKGTWV